MSGLDVLRSGAIIPWPEYPAEIEGIMDWVVIKLSRW